MPDINDVNFEIEPIIDKLTYDKLQEVEKKLYREKDGNYEIKIKGGYEDAGKIKTKNQQANEHLKATQKKLDALEKEKQDLLKKLADDETIKEELDQSKKSETEIAKRLRLLEENHANEKALAAKREQILQEKALNGEKEKIINKLQSLIRDDERYLTRDYFASRISVIPEGDGFKTVFLDHNYQPVETDLAGYEKKVVAIKELQSKIKTTQASGGGATPSFLQGGATPKYKDLTTAQKAELLDADPVLFKQLQEESRPKNFRK